jgi:nucleotide-binding universal stress UspA family protein
MNPVPHTPAPATRRTIVVGVDRSPGALTALQHAANRAGPTGRLLLATVVTPISDAFGRGVSGLRSERREAAQELVDRLAGTVAVDTETRVLEGDPAERMAQLARESGANEIVVGSRGTGRIAAALGSVSHALLAHADHPVVVVPQTAAEDSSTGPDQRGRSVVVGYGGSPPAEAALAYATAQAGDGGRVVAVHAFEPVPSWLGRPRYQQALDTNQAHGRELLRSLQDRGGVATSLLEGPAARAIAAAADVRDADEIVVGSRGFGALRGLAGSVSHSLLHEADRPVVVIPAAAVPVAA